MVVGTTFSGSEAEAAPGRRSRLGLARGVGRDVADVAPACAVRSACRLADRVAALADSTSSAVSGRRPRAMTSDTLGSLSVRTGCSAMRASTSVSQACGSTSFILEVYAARQTMPNALVLPSIFVVTGM